MSLAGMAWHLGAMAIAPLLPLHLRRRAGRGKEIAARLPERRGEGAARPAGRLLWIHAASVGETLSILPVMEILAERAPDLSLLVTTGTVTSATLLGQRLPPALAPRMIHRFVPLDVPGWVERFLEGWRPDAAAFVESELWPNLIAAARRRGLPMALVNARMSERSARRWGWARGLAADLLGGFDRVWAQSEADARRLAALGAAVAENTGNLKSAAPPLPADPAALAALRAAIGARPVFLAASTHPGEEAMVAAAIPAMAAALPGLLTVIVPRHPERGPAIAAELAARPGALAPPRRAAGALPGPETALYIADTLGELGLFYRLAGAALVGGSLVPHGGQNPLEPARLGCPVLIGPHAWNFAEPVARLRGAGALVEVAEAAALAPAAIGVLGNAAEAARLAMAGRDAVATEAGLPGLIADGVLALLPPAAAAPVPPVPAETGA